MNNFSPSFGTSPIPAASHGQMVDDAYVEFCRRELAGEQIDPEKYCREHPSIQSSLLRLIQVGQFIGELPRKHQSPPPEWPSLGQVYQGEFDLAREIGVGAFSRVYLAQQATMGGRWVVVKVSPHGASEAQTLGRISHPNIVTIHSMVSDSANQLSAICMPLQGYATLHQILDHVKAAPAPPKDAAFVAKIAAAVPAGLPRVENHALPRVRHDLGYAEYVRQVAQQMLAALAHVHLQGIVHSDLKPSNVLLTPGAAPLLLDFNLSEDDRQNLLRFGGTLPYMSPEQLQHTLQQPGEAAKLSPKSDLYSLGVILFELLTGRHPFGPLDGSLPFDDLRRRLMDNQRNLAVRVSEGNPDVDAEFAAFIEQCLSPDADQRPDSAQAALDLEQQPSEPALQAEAELARPTTPRRSRKKAMLVCLALAAIALVPIMSHLQRNRLSDFEMGMNAYHEGRWEDAVRLHTRAMATEEDEISVRVERAKAQLRIAEQYGGVDQERFAEAVEDLYRVYKGRTDAESKVRLAYAVQGRGDNKDSMAMYQQAIKLGYKQASAWNNLGLAFRRLNKPAERLDAFNRAIELDPEHPAPRQNRADAYLELALNSSPGNDKNSLLDKAESDCAVALLKRKSGSLFLLQAAILANQHGQQRDCCQLMVDSLHSAIKHGYDPKDLVNDRSFPARFRSSDDFKTLTQNRPSNPHLLMPFPVMSPLDD